MRQTRKENQTLLEKGGYRNFAMISCYWQVFSEADLGPIMRRFKVIHSTELPPPRPAETRGENPKYKIIIDMESLRSKMINYVSGPGEVILHPENYYSADCRPAEV